jgi:hypothetical protein
LSSYNNHLLLKNRIKTGLLVGLFGSFLFAYTSGYAQEIDSLDLKIPVKKHSPPKALLFSAVLPGLGQVYNQKYWKVPIIYGAIGGFAYAISYNQLKYQKFRDALIYGEPGKPAYIDGETYPYDVLARGRDYYRRYRDLSVFGLALIYFLNVVDAMIDAHFFYYDVSDDLSMRMEPVIIQNPNLTASVGFSIKLGF